MTENEIPDVKVPMLVLEKKWQQVFASKDIVIIYPNGTCILEYKECWHDLTIFFSIFVNHNKVTKSIRERRNPEKSAVFPPFSAGSFFFSHC